jgi:hypothetical protein
MTSRRLPVLACAVLMFFATVILAGCAAPMANRAYRVLLSGALTGQGMGGARSAADLTLWSALFSAYPVNVRVVMHVLSLATAAASLLVLGAQLSRLRWRGRVTAWIGLPVVYVLLGELFSVRSLTPFLGAQAAVLLPLSLPIWGLAAAALAAASWMVSSDLRAGVRRTTPRPSER